MAIKNVLVTGSSGTIGTRLCEKLLEDNFNVIGADWKKNKWSRLVDNLTINVDLRDRAAVFRALPKNIDLLIHLAANARVYDLVVDPVLARDNFETTFNALEFARISGIKRVMFASSRETYGNAKKIKYSEGDVRIENCESPYTATKIAGESLVQAYRRCYGIDFIIFRFSNVYGMYDESNRVVPLFIREAAKNQNLAIFGKEKLLDFTYIDDVVSGVLAVIKKFNKTKNNVINLAAGEGASILNVAKMIMAGMHSGSKIVLQKSRTGEVIKYIADISKAKKLLGFKPKVNIADGIKLSIEWYKKAGLL